MLVQILLEEDTEIVLDVQEIYWEKHLCRTEEGAGEGGKRLQITMQV